MSCNNWEAGTLKFSVAEFAKFKKAFREGFNRIQAAKKAQAIRHWEKYKTGETPDHDEYAEERYLFHILYHNIENDENGRPQHANRKNPRKPTAKHWAPANKKQTAFYCGEASIYFNRLTREVRYESGNNHHAVERARESNIGKLFFDLLYHVQWTRGTGGEFVGNDEYCQADRSAGGGGNYVTATYPSAIIRTRMSF